MEKKKIGVNFWNKNTDVELMIRIVPEHDADKGKSYIIVFGGHALTHWRFRSKEDAKLYLERHRETVIATIALIVLKANEKE